MRKVKRGNRLAQLAFNKPLPIVRFDISEFSGNLLRAPSNRSIDFCKKTINLHKNILKLSAAEANSVCLASNQVMLDSSLIAIHKKIKENQSKQRGMNWIDLSYDMENEFKVYHCPKVLKGKQLFQHIQQSISYPFILFKVKRYNNIVIEFKDENFNKQQAELKDFQAWAFQQSYEQIKGDSLLDWRINQGKIQFNSQVTQYFPKSTSVIQEYVQDLAKTFKQYPTLLYKPQSFGHPNQRRNQMQNEVLPYEADFYNRLTRHYQRQMRYLEQRSSQGQNLDSQQQKWKEPKDIKVKIIDK